MVGVRPGARTAAATVAGTALVMSLSVASGPAAADGHATDAAVAAARWQAAELTADGSIPGMGGTPDWGLTVDTLIALEATGADPEAAGKAVTALKSHVRDYNSYDAWGEKGQRVAGATAKLLFAAVISGSDPEKFGTYDLRQETLDLIAGADTGLENGRVKDKVAAPSTDNSNTFGQSLAVLGLARSGEVPQNAVDFLIDQQCSSGGFRLYPYAFGGDVVTGDCDAQDTAAVLDPDSTAMAVQALLAAADSGADGAAEAAGKGADWLLERQAEDGSVGGSGPTSAANANSTGLAGEALAATGHQKAADKAADWVLRHQLTKDDGKAAADAGAIAYNQDSLDTARSDGIADFQRDQWRRATPQALLALAQVPLGEIGTGEPGPGPSGSPDPGDSTSPGDPGDSTGPGGDPDSSASPSPSPPASGSPSGGESSSPAITPSDDSGSGGADTDGGSGALASTGSGVLPWTGGAGALLITGYVLNRATARRREGTHS